MPMRPQTNQNHKYLLMNGLFELLLLEELQYQEHELPAERRHPATPPPPPPAKPQITDSCTKQSPNHRSIPQPTHQNNNGRKAGPLGNQTTQKNNL